MDLSYFSAGHHGDRPLFSRPPTSLESAPPRPESAPSPPTQAEVPQTQEQEGAPEPPRSGVEGDPITISDTSGGNEMLRDVRPMDEETSTPLVTGRTPWPAGLRALEEQKKKEEEEEREREARRQPQEQGRRQESQEHEEQQQQQRQQQQQQQQVEQQQQMLEGQQQQHQGGQGEGPLEPPPHSPPQSVPPAPQEPGEHEDDLQVYGPPTPALLLPGAPAAIRAEPGRADGVVALACMMRTPADPEFEIRRTIYGMDRIALGFLRERRAWEDRFPSEEDEIGTSGRRRHLEDGRRRRAVPMPRRLVLAPRGLPRDRREPYPRRQGAC